jgi:hypothetical protein
MVRLILRRKKKVKAKTKDKSQQKDEVLSSHHQDEDHGSISTVSSGTQYPYNYADSVNGSLVAQFAQMSTTIAATLTEKEFGTLGTHENNLYRPNAEYDRRIIHPVECKRDIFVESVTPVKKKKSSMRRSRKSSSIYHVNIGRERSPYIESNDVHNNSKSTKKALRVREQRNEINKGITDGTPMDTVPYDESSEDCESLALTTVSSGEKENEVRRNANRYNTSNSTLSRQSGSNFSRTKKVFGNASNASLGGQMKSRPNNNLRVETKSIRNVGNEVSQLNSDGLFREHPRVSRLTTMEISPSSTVSSLTLPAEIDLSMFTPKEVFHPTTMPIITEDDGKYSEI